MNKLSLLRRNLSQVIALFAIIFLNTFNASAQCAADTCNSVYTIRILQASYHSQIAKTNGGYLITGQDLATNGSGNQTIYTAIPCATYPMPEATYPLLGALGGRTQAVFLADNGVFYAVGDENKLISSSVTSDTDWDATTLSLPSGVSVCDVQRLEGTAGDQVNGGFMGILSGIGNQKKT